MCMKLDYNARCARLLEELEGRGLDAFLLADPPGVRYYTGFSGTSGFSLVDSEGACLVTDPRYRLQAPEEAAQAEIVIYESGIYGTLAKICSDRGYRRVGFEPAALTVAFLSAVRRELKDGTRLVAVPGRVSKPRTLKEAGEVRLMRKAARLSEAALESLLEKEDLLAWRERDVAAEMESGMRKMGAEDRAFPTIAVSGPRSALPHGRSTSRRLKEGTVLLVDWGAGFGGYQADLTRTIWLGRPRGRLKRAYAAVLESRERVLESLRPGVRAADMDRLAREIIERAGFGGNISHSLGHGVGLEVHEPPYLSINSKERLKEGMVFTLEPGIYLPGIGGIRVEDMVRLGQGGPRLLTSLPTEIVYT